MLIIIHLIIITIININFHNININFSSLLCSGGVFAVLVMCWCVMIVSLSP